MLWSVVGYIRVKMSGENVIEFFDECKKCSIELKNIRHFSGSYYADVLSTSVKKLISLSRRCGVDTGVEGRFGLAMKFFIYKNRIAFALAFALFALIFCINSFFINDIRITGNSFLTDEQITAVLKECGIYPGRFTLSVQPEETQRLIRQKCSALSWVWIDIKGTTANVDVREKVSRPEFFDANRACNVVAERDGVITEAIAEMGTLYAETGTYVQKGQLLIGGVYDSNDYAPVRFVHAAGTVYAKTTYTLKGDFPLSYTSYKLSDSFSRSFGIKFGKNAFETSVYEASDVKIYSNDKNFKVFGKFSTPLGFTNRKYCEIIKEECILDKDAAAQRAINELSARLSARIPHDATVVNTQKEISDNPDGSLSVQLTFECVEDITAELPIEISQ